MDGEAPRTEVKVAQANGLEIAYETFGDRASSPLLLIAGLGGQMISWDDPFCDMLVRRGFYVIRFDNRDAGYSTRLEKAGVPDIASLYQAGLQGKPVEAPYTLSDMALDALGLLEALDFRQADIVGISLGGMIAQTMAIEHPRSVRTLTSIMSTTGDPNLPLPSAEALALLLTPSPAERGPYLEHAWRWKQALSGPKYPEDKQRIRARAARAFDRGLYPEGAARHMAAMLASGSRKEALAAVSAPTLVIHGDADPLVPVEGGIDTAGSIRGAKLTLIRGLGHGLPPAVWPQVTEEIAYHAH